MRLPFWISILFFQKVSSGSVSLMVQTAEVPSGRSYQSHYGSRLHFGLGRHPRIDRIEIRWHRGDTQILEDLAVDQLHAIIEPIR